MDVMDAVLKSYRKTALKVLTIRQAEEVFDEVVGHLRAEVNSRRNQSRAAPRRRIS
jgi:hypothetical protein